jgi:hypothetical protein
MSNPCTRGVLRAAPLLLLLPLLPVTGCSLNHFGDVSSSASVLPTISGHVHGGQQAISGATIKLYAASTTTLKGWFCVA